jgi:transglutaminase-like putative cysteine protease
MKNNRQTGMVWVIATLFVAILPQISTMPIHLLPLVMIPIIWRLVAEFRNWKPVPMLVRVAITILAVLILVMTYGGLLGRGAAVSLLTLMMCLKLLDTFKVRDARVVASLCLFLCGTQFLWSQGINMLFYGGGVMVGALVSMTLLQRREAFQVKGAAPASGYSLFSELGYSSKLLAMAIPIAIALFLFFPRWGSPMWGVPESTLDAKSGLSDSMSPGSIQSLFMDDSPAFRANFESTIPPPGQMYWRGPVFWQFDGQEWRSNYYSRNIRATEFPEESPASWRYTVQLEPTEQHWIFALDYPVTLPRGVRSTMDFQLYTRRSITQLKSYSMVSNPDFVDSPELSSVHRGEALRLPAGFNPRTIALVRQWRAETPSDTELINRVLRYFNEQEFRYTLNPPLLSQHTVDEFIFDTRAGFCEHYASAFTLMMRMAGIPSRIVTGYQGGYYNQIGNYILVRQSDAHAWSEVWLEGMGWARVDPTASVAPERIEGGAMDAMNGRRHMLDYEWLMTVKNGFDLLQLGWNDWVIAFDSVRQQNLFMPFGTGSLDSKRMVAIMFILVSLISVVMLPVILRLKLSGNLDEAGKQWLLFRKKLDAAGLASSPAMTPSEIKAAAGDLAGDHRKDVERITLLYRDIRYAPESPEVKELQTAIKAFKPQKKSA